MYEKARVVPPCKASARIHFIIYCWITFVKLKHSLEIGHSWLTAPPPHPHTHNLFRFIYLKLKNQILKMNFWSIGRHTQFNFSAYWLLFHRSLSLYLVGGEKESWCVKPVELQTENWTQILLIWYVVLYSRNNYYIWTNWNCVMRNRC